MMLHIPQVLTAEQIQAVDRLLSEARFVSGKSSAGMAAQRVKSNEEVAPDAEQTQRLNQIVMNSLVRHPTYRSAALPYRVAAPFFARYGPGMAYGDHVDDPVMGAGERYRSDISITVFLNEPEAYDGGELVIHGPLGERRVKLPAGDAILYPSYSLHHVTEVTRGERRVAVTWVQSLIRDTAKRELLFELDTAREKLLTSQPDAEETQLVNNAYANLVRMWAEV